MEDLAPRPPAVSGAPLPYAGPSLLNMSKLVNVNHNYLFIHQGVDGHNLQRLHAHNSNLGQETPIRVFLFLPNTL